MASVHDAISIGSQRKRTREGFLTAPAVIGRAGILEYQPTDAAMIDAPAELRGGTRSIRILRSESDVFASDSMASFAGRPVLNEHSVAKVTPSNYREHLVGVTGSDIKRDGDNMRADLVIYDAAVIDSIEMGKSQLSQGYDATTDWTPGNDPKFGDYDGRFTNIVGNHIAVTLAGRSGPEVRILDSINKGVRTVKRNINGVEIEIDDAVVGVVDSYLAGATKTAADLAAATGKIAVLEKTIADNAKEIARVTDSTYIDTRVKERAALVDSAKKIAPSIVCDGLSDDAIRAACVLAKGIKLENADAISGAFAALCVAPITPDPSAAITDALNAGTTPVKSPEELYNEARNAYAASQRKGA